MRLIAARSRRMWPLLAAVAIVSLLLAGCGDDERSERRLAYDREQAEKQRLSELGRQPVWVGTIAEFDETAVSDYIEFDYGGEYPRSVDLARIQPLGCGSASYKYEDGRVYASRLRVAVPVGARFALVRSIETTGVPNDEGFLHYLTPDGRPDMDRPTVNEEMVAAGIAEPDPGVELRPAGSSEPRPLSAQIEQERQMMSDLDFSYWTRFIRAHVDADERRVARAGTCAEQEIRDRRESENATRESEERIRRWELGPDGRRGTADDFTDQDGDGRRDTGGGSGSGGFDFPDSLCPTRFC